MRKVTAATGESHAAKVERELMFLARALEALQRKRAYPLERAQFIILRLLIEEGPQGVGKLAKQLLLDDSTMTRQVATLQKKGLVRRASDPADGRAGMISATAEGEAMMKEMLALRQARVARYLGGWKAAEQQDFARLLGRLNATLTESLGE